MSDTPFRTIVLDDMKPAELAYLFAEMDSNEQAQFFEHLGALTSRWPGLGWCGQSYEIARSVNSIGRQVIETLAGHVLEKSQ